MVTVPFVILVTGAILWLYEWAADHDTVSILFAHIFFVALVLLLRKHIFNFEKINISISRKGTIWIIALWFILLSVDYFISLERLTTYTPEDNPLRRLWLNVPLILTFVISIAWKLAFLWYGCRKLSLRWGDMGLRVTSISSIGFWTVIVSSFLLVRLFWYGDWPADILWSPKLALAFSFDIIGNTSGAILEEILFRGLFFTVLRSRMSTISAWIGQAMLFGLSHIFVSDPIYAIGPGLLFGAGVLGSGSLYPGIFAHLLMNILGALNAASSAAL
jgi:membrane protease YdiL (CAAX protease family)